MDIESRHVFSGDSQTGWGKGKSTLTLTDLSSCSHSSGIKGYSHSIYRGNQEGVFFKPNQGTHQETNFDFTPYSPPTEKRVLKHKFTPITTWFSALSCMPTCFLHFLITGVKWLSFLPTVPCKAHCLSSLIPFIWCLSQLCIWPRYLWLLPFYYYFPYLWDIFNFSNLKHLKIKK